MPLKPKSSYRFSTKGKCSLSLRYPDPEDRIFHCVISVVPNETTLTISNSTVTG